MKKRLFLLILSTAIHLSSSAQLVYPVVGHYKSQPSQGMAIWKNKAYLLNNTGICRVYDLKKEKVENEFLLGCANNTNHANSATFGNEIIEGCRIPAMYISECGQRKRCFVEGISNGKSILVQSISATFDGKELPLFQWTVDSKGGFLYGITWDDAHPLDTLGNKVNTVIKYRLPKLKEGTEIVLTEKDIIDSFSVTFPNIQQGCKVKGNKLYMTLGLEEASSHRKDSGRAIAVIDLKRKKLKKFIDLTKITVNEPEDLAFYKNNILVWCGQQGGLYKVKY